MTPQNFVKKKYPNAKNMYQDGAGHAIMYFDQEAMKNVILSYGHNSANAWATIRSICGNRKVKWLFRIL